MPCRLMGRKRPAAATAAPRPLAEQPGWQEGRGNLQGASRHSAKILAAAACRRQHQVARRGRRPRLLPSQRRPRRLSAAQRRPAVAARRKRRRRGSVPRRQRGLRQRQAAAVAPRIQKQAPTRMCLSPTQVGRAVLGVADVVACDAAAHQPLMCMASRDPEQSFRSAARLGLPLAPCPLADQCPASSALPSRLQRHPAWPHLPA